MNRPPAIHAQTASSTRLAQQGRHPRHPLGERAGRAAPAASRSLWRHPDFLKLWAGETVSALGSQITPLALPLTAALVLEATPGQMGALRAAHFLPPILVGLVAGAWVDRLRRRPVLIGTSLARALVLLTIPAAATLGLLRVELLYAVALAMGLLAVIFRTAAAAYLPSLVSR
ncbi:MAG: MFS transporter, partial [Chloroflexota bacterium]